MFVKCPKRNPPNRWMQQKVYYLEELEWQKLHGLSVLPFLKKGWMYFYFIMLAAVIVLD